jgi:hypothetical protein
MSALKRLLLRMLDSGGADDQQLLTYDLAADRWYPADLTVQVTESSTPPDLPTSVGDWRFWIDNTEEIPLLKAETSDGTVLSFWPIYTIPNGGTPPVELHPKTIILEEGP